MVPGLGAGVGQGGAKAKLDVVCCSAAWFNLESKLQHPSQGFPLLHFQNESSRNLEMSAASMPNSKGIHRAISRNGVTPKCSLLMRW